MTATTTVLQDTPVENVSKIVDQVASKKDEWKELPVQEKAKLLEQVLKNAAKLHHEWIAVAAQARNIDSHKLALQGSGMADVEICGPAMFGGYGHQILGTLKCASKNGTPPKPKKTRVIGDDHCAVTVYPDGLLELTETVGLKGELILKGTTPDQYQYEDYAVGGVAGILGAGNYDVPTDLLTQLFLKGRVCVYKPNPVSQATNPVLQKIFAPLVERGYLGFCIGSAQVGTALVQHSSLNEIVMTGSPSTLSKIQPLTTTPIVSELGAVNPWIIVPGKHWNKRSIDGHARALAWAKMVNNGHVCAAPQVFLVASDWKWRQAFVDRVSYWLSEYAGSAPFYPHSGETHAHFGGLHPNAQVLPLSKEQAFAKQQAPVLITNVGGSADDKKLEEVLTREAFCPVLAEVVLEDCSEKDGGVAFLKSAATYAETKLFGSLTCTILMDDKTGRKKEVDEILAQMKFGFVGINMLPAFGYSLARLMWGAFPGQTESGSGFLGNACLYQRPEKAILRAPFWWIGRRLVSVLPAKQSSLIFHRMAKYKLKPNFATQVFLFSALFLGV